MAFDPQSAAKKSVVLLMGDDALARAEGLAAVLSAAQADEVETETFVADASDPLQWVAAALTAPFFAERRVVVVRNIGRVSPDATWREKLDEAHPGVALFKQVPDTGLIVLVGDDELGDEERQTRAQARVREWAKFSQRVGGNVAEFKFDPSKTADLLRKRAAELGKKMSPRAASTLSQMVGGKPILAVGELEKVALYVGGAPEIREDDVTAAATPEYEYSVFQLVDAVTSGNPGASVKQLRLLAGQTSQIAERAIARVFPLISGQLRLVWQVRFALDAKENPARPSPGHEQWLPSKRFASESDWRQKKVLPIAHRLALGQVAQCMDLLVEAEAELKGQKSAFEPMESLERMVLSMASVCQSPVKAK